MGVQGPKVVCHKCGARVRIEGDGKMKQHNRPGTLIPCLGSREKPK